MFLDMSTSSKLSKGVSLSSQSRQIMNNVYELCCEERDLQKVSQSSTTDPQARFLIPLTQINRRVSHLTGVSERSITRIVSQRSEGPPEGPPISPVKRSTWQCKVSAVDDWYRRRKLGWGVRRLDEVWRWSSCYEYIGVGQMLLFVCFFFAVQLQVAALASRCDVKSIQFTVCVMCIFLWVKMSWIPCFDDLRCGEVGKENHSSAGCSVLPFNWKIKSNDLHSSKIQWVFNSNSPMFITQASRPACQIGTGFTSHRQLRSLHSFRKFFSRFLQIRLGSESCDQISASPNRPKRAKSRDKTAGILFTRAYTLVKFSQTKRCFFSFL